MTCKELHNQKIIPLRQELQKLEEEYKQLYRKEKGEEIGEKIANCGNCANSCIIICSDHNECLYGNCTCCHDFCYGWTPENEVSRYLRENYPYCESIVWKLKDLFGNDFLKKCGSPDKLEVVLEALRLIEKMDERDDTE